MNEQELAKMCNKSTSDCIELAKQLKEAQDKIDKAIKLLDNYKLGKYDYSLTPAGLLELEDILRGKEVENE